MANHRFQGDIYTLEKFPVALYGYCTSADYSEIASTSTDIKTANRSLGIDFIYYTGNSKFKIGLKQSFHSILFIGAICEVADSSIASVDIIDDDVDGASPYVEVQLLDHGGAALDLVNSTIIRFKLELRNSALG